MESEFTFLQRYHDDGAEFLHWIIIGDETWVTHITLETEQQSLYWRHSGSLCRTKFKQTMSARKVMCTVFWDRLVPIPGSRLLRHRDIKVGPTVWQMSQFLRWICWKIVNICSIYSNWSFHYIGFVSVKAQWNFCGRDTYNRMIYYFYITSIMAQLGWLLGLKCLYSYWLG